MARPPGSIKQHLDDFVVEEIPLYEPCGAGEHVYIRFEKRGLTTDEAVRRIADALGTRARDAGVAGLKDRHGITRQTISVLAPVKDAGFEGRALSLSLEGIAILSVARHGNKLRTGHLAGNRFVVRVRDVPAERVPDAVEALERVGREGVPNAFGDQRFGRAGDNAAQALAWLRGEERGPRDPRQQRFLFSALQSAVFNRVLERRVHEGSWKVPLLGDVLRVKASRGLFVCSDPGVDRERAERGEVSPTGPMPGVRMVRPEGEALAIELEEERGIVGDSFDWATHARLGEGTRRPLGLEVRRMQVTVDRDGVRASFDLPSGAYATTVLGHVFTLAEDAPPTVAARREPHGALAPHDVEKS